MSGLLRVGKVYTSRKGSRSPYRVIIWISADGEKVQYDGPAVRWGQRFPVVSRAAFLKWAGLSE